MEVWYSEDTSRAVPPQAWLFGGLKKSCLKTLKLVGLGLRGDGGGFPVGQ